MIAAAGFYFVMTILPMIGFNLDVETPARDVGVVTRTEAECWAERFRAFADSDYLYDLRFTGHAWTEPTTRWWLVALPREGCQPLPW